MSPLDPGLALYVAAAVALLVWLAIFAYLWSLDKRVRTLREKLEQHETQAHVDLPAPPLQAVRNRSMREADETQDGV